MDVALERATRQRDNVRQKALRYLEVVAGALLFVVPMSVVMVFLLFGYRWCVANWSETGTTRWS